MTDPWCCYIWCSMDPINKNPSHVSINIPAPAGSVMGIGCFWLVPCEAIPLGGSVGWHPPLSCCWLIRIERSIDPNPCWTHGVNEVPENHEKNSWNISWKSWGSLMEFLIPALLPGVLFCFLCSRPQVETGGGDFSTGRLRSYFPLLWWFNQETCWKHVENIWCYMI